MIDNYSLVLPFVPVKDDGDTFIYTEMLFRGAKKGNNNSRLLKAFYHRSQEDFESQFDTIKKLCELSGARACTRLSKRSYRQVAKRFLSLVTETFITENYAGMKTLYNRACGTTKPIEKLWLVDCDSYGEYESAYMWLSRNSATIKADIPSKKGRHIIVSPFNLSTWPEGYPTIHKDNPTNLYIPEGAD